MKKLITTGIVSLLVLTAVLTVPILNAKNMESTDASSDYESIIAGLPGDVSDQIISLFDYVKEGRGDVIEDNFPGLIEGLDNLFHSPENQESDENNGPTPEEDAMSELNNVAQIIKSKVDDDGNNIYDECSNACDEIDEDLYEKLNSDQIALYNDALDELEKEENSDLKTLLETLCDELPEDLDLADYAKLILWFVWVVSCAGVIGAPGSLIIIGLIEAMAVALVVCLQCEGKILNTANNEKIFPKGKLSTTQRIVVVALVLAAGIIFAFELLTGPGLHSIILMVAGIVGVNLIVNEIVERWNNRDTTPVYAGPFMNLLRTFIQWFVSDVNPNAFPILQRLLKL